MHIHDAIVQLFQSAYAPCSEFRASCKTMRWDPKAGHVPRGFAGAVGELREVELVLVFAEPGNPKPSESHNGLSSAFNYAYSGYCYGNDRFYANVRTILDSCWPNLSTKDQMRKVWLTDSVLCSATIECGQIPSSCSHACGTRFLAAQLKLFHNALVVAVGYKARNRLRALGIKDFIYVYAAAPPGCNRRAAKLSWEQIPRELKLWLSKHV